MQTSMNDDPTRAFPGLVSDSSRKVNVISRILSKQQLELVTIVGNDAGTFTITIDGDVEATFIKGGAETTADICDDLFADLQASTKQISVTQPTATTILILFTDETATTDTTIAVNSTGTGGDITVAQQQSQSGNVGFGIGVVTDPQEAASGTQCRLPTATGEITAGTFLGIARADTSLPNDAGNGYTDRSAVSIQRDGPIWVRTEDACVKGGQVFCRFQDPHTGFGLGSFRSDADTADAVAVPGAMFMLDSGVSGLNIVEMNPTR